MPRNTFANVTSVLALVVAIGGTSYAAVQLPKDSVGSKQIRSNAVKSPDIKDGAVKATDLSSTTIADLKAPRAYGVFTSTGLLVAQRSKNATVTKIGVGSYCVSPTPSSGIDPTRTTIIATPDLSDGAGQHHLVELVSATGAIQNPSCTKGFYLRTANETAGAFANTDIAVSFVIP